MRKGLTFQKTIGKGSDLNIMLNGWDDHTRDQ